MTYISKNINDLSEISRQILQASTHSHIFTFEGQLGAGKTSLIKAMCKEIGYHGEVTSPTFSLVNEYQGSDFTIYHMDLYRVQNEEELYEIGFEEYLDSGNFCYIEWPQMAGNLIFQQHYKIEISVRSNESRKIECTFVH